MLAALSAFTKKQPCWSEQLEPSCWRLSGCLNSTSSVATLARVVSGQSTLLVLLRVRRDLRSNRSRGGRPTLLDGRPGPLDSGPWIVLAVDHPIQAE